MAFISSNYKPVFTSEAMPRLVTLYRAETPYTSMPRTMHRHGDVAEFILITEGSGIHIIDGQRYYTQKGDLLLIGQDVVHDESSPANRNLSIYSGAIRGLQLPDLPAGKFLPPDVLPILKTDALFPDFCHLLELMYRCVQGEGTHPEEIINHLLCAMLLRIMDVTSHCVVLPPEEHHLMAAVRSRLDTAYDETITLAGLAQEFHVSTFHFAHAFKAAYGYAPLQYITRRRIGEAQTLLIDTALPITEISIRTGYNSSSYFNKAFHKITGMSPRDYRKAYRKI
jgi:AraC-like DNA-binding protein